MCGVFRHALKESVNTETNNVMFHRCTLVTQADMHWTTCSLVHLHRVQVYVHENVASLHGVVQGNSGNGDVGDNQQQAQLLCLVHTGDRAMYTSP